MTSLLRTVSLTGPDDATPLSDLHVLGAQFPTVEWGLLYVPGKECHPRNPGAAWRKAFFANRPQGSVAVHLCGAKAFEQMLADELPAEILLANKLQLNINARRPEFTDEQVLGVYEKALTLEPGVILQRHEFTIGVLHEFIKGLTADQRQRVSVLLDESRGKGITPTDWSVPEGLEGVSVVFAGGMGPHNVRDILPKLEAHGIPYGIDMESGIRTDNAYDIEKVRAVLEACEPLGRS